VNQICSNFERVTSFSMVSTLVALSLAGLAPEAVVLGPSHGRPGPFVPGALPGVDQAPRPDHELRTEDQGLHRCENRPA
jgi:hypothetical protein